MYTHVQSVLVGKASGAVSTAQTTGSPLVLSTVVVGDLYLVDDNGIVLDATSAAAATSAKVVRGTGNAKVMAGSLMKKAGTSTKYTFQSYVAPVAQVSDFADLGLTANKEYKLQIVIQEDLRTIANRQNRIEVTLTTGAVVGVADLTRLVANFNKQRRGSVFITASVLGTTGIRLTSKPIPTYGIGDYEFMSFDSNFVTVTGVNAVTGQPYNLTSPTAIQPSTNTPASGGKGVAVQVRQIERVGLGNFGFGDLTHTYMRGLTPYGAVDGVGYDIYNVQQHLSHEGVLQDTMTSPVSTFVAIATGSAQATAFSAALTAFIGVNPE